ncbi:MAG: hypothetical protein AAF567_03355 [Actinomycetota bacterium]
MTSATGWRVVAERAASQHGAFHRSQAASQLSARTLRRAELRGELRRPMSDVFVFASHPDSWRQRLMTFSLVGSVASHRAAAALHGLDGFAEGKLEVVQRRSARRQLPGHVTLHRTTFLDGADISTVDGIDCTSIERTLIDLGQVLPPLRVEPALDSALRRGVSVRALELALDRLQRPGRSGVGPLRRLLADPARAGVVPDSLFERLLERLMRERGLPAPVRQFEVVAGGECRRVDLAWPQARLAVEAHSRRWHFGRAAESSDHVRDLALAAAGWEVLYITWDQLQQPDHFVRHLRTILESRLRSSAAG